MHIAIVVSDLTYHSHELKRQVEALGAECTLILPKQTSVFTQGGEIQILDATGEPVRAHMALNWVLAPGGSGLEIIEAFMAQGTPIINTPQAWERAKCKPLTGVFLARAGLPHPQILFSSGNPPALEKHTPSLGSPMVFKPWRGGGGLGIKKVKKTADLDPPIYLEEFIPNPGRDIRVVVVGEEAVTAAYRVAKKGHWKTNISAGHGEYRSCRLNPELAQLAIDATRALGLDISGVDIIEGPQGYVILEVNARPGFAKIEQALGVKIGEAIAAYVVQRAKTP